MLARITGNLARFVLSIIAAGENATDEVVDSLDRQFGTDRPAAIQYWDWFSRLWPGDFGVSCLSRTDICALVADEVQVSLILVILVILVTLTIAVRAASQLGVVVPGFPLGIVLVSFFAFRPGWLPANGWVSPGGRTSVPSFRAWCCPWWPWPGCRQRSWRATCAPQGPRSRSPR